MSPRFVMATLLLSVVVLISACGNTTITTTTPPASTTPPDPGPVNDLRNRFQDAFNAGDATAVAALYTDDAILLPDHHAPVQGKAAIQQYYQDMFAQLTPKFTLTSPDLEITGDIAHETGSYAIAVTPKGRGNAMTETGKYLVVLKKQPDGSWKLHHDMDNTNSEMAMPGMPMPGAGRQ